MLTDVNGASGWWRNMGLQTKLLLGLMVAIGIAGGSGLYFTSRISASVNILTGVASPLREEAIGLVEETRQLHIEMLEEMSQTYAEPEDQNEPARPDHESEEGDHDKAGEGLDKEDAHTYGRMENQIATLRKHAEQAFQRLDQLSARGGLALDSKPARDLGSEFNHLASGMLAAHEQDGLKAALARQRLVKFEEERRLLEAKLGDLVGQAEAGMNEREDGIRTLAQSGSATVDGLQEEIQQVFDHSYPILHGGYTLLAYLMKLQNAVRGYLAEQHIDGLAEHEQAFGKFVKRFKSRLRRVRSRAGEGQTKQDIAGVLQEFLALETIVQAENGLFVTHRASLEAAAKANALQASLARTGNQFEAALGKIAEQARDLYQRVKQETNAQASTAKRALSATILVGGVISLLFGLVFARRISVPVRQLTLASREIADGMLSVRVPVRDNSDLGQMGQSFNQMAGNLEDIVRSVQQSGIQVASSATEMSATVKEQEASATEQAATANQIVASSKEISGTAKDLLRSMDQVAEVAGRTAGLAQEGTVGLAQMQGNMEQMAEASRSISDKLSVLNEKASSISSVVTTINKVADQTNLLSLNAAIEAEKAGEYGIGFGVVATEIRRLADQTAVATWDIEQVVKEMRSAVSSGVMGMEKFSEEVRRGVADSGRLGGQLSRIVEQVQALAPHFETVHEGMQSQTRGAEQIDEAIGQLSETVTQTAASLRDSGWMIEQLNEASRRMQTAVSDFKLSEELSTDGQLSAGNP